MKKTRVRKPASRASDSLRPEYRFDYGKSQSNKYARGIARGAVVIVLDQDVAEVFQDSARVNALLRATIAAVERPRSRRVG